tara:strand:+ start:247 stop:750 length:504 start_codon:yes stop_codon:yes gene_type:complete
MDSIISLVVIALFIIILYGWSSNFYDKHKYNKKLYMLYKTYNGASQINDGSKDGSKDGSDSDDIPPSELTCDNNPCKNGGTCVSGSYTLDGVEMQYRCVCHSSSGVDSNGKPYSGRSYSGYNCEFINDDSEGVGVKLLENIDELVAPVIFEKEPMFKIEKNQWNNYL